MQKATINTSFMDTYEALIMKALSTTEKPALVPHQSKLKSKIEKKPQPMQDEAKATKKEKQNQKENNGRQNMGMEVEKMEMEESMKSEQVPLSNQQKYKRERNRPIVVKLTADGDMIQDSPSQSPQTKKERKTRVTITQEKLDEMNRIFATYTQQKQVGLNTISLKTIGKELQLGYSTVLHKFREFRATKKVKGGALIASLKKKRQYRKSKHIQDAIRKALDERPFFTAVQLSKHIQKQSNLNLSRSIISRHLGQMGFSYKNLTTPISITNRSDPAIQQMRLTYLYSHQHIKSLGIPIFYVDELTFKRSDLRWKQDGMEGEQQMQLSLLVIANAGQIAHHAVILQEVTPQNFIDFIKQFLNKEEFKQLAMNNTSSVFILDMDYPHLLNPPASNPPIRQLFSQIGCSLLWIPPQSYEFNVLSYLFNELRDVMLRIQYQSMQQAKQRLKQVLQNNLANQLEEYYNQLTDHIAKIRDSLEVKKQE